MKAVDVAGVESLMTVTVVAPRFPSINQPWIDTYLEQLLIKGYSPSIFSFNRVPGRYHAKVDRLGLLARVFYFPLVLTTRDCLKVCCKGLARLRSVARALRAMRRLRPGLTAWFHSYCELLQFAMEGHRVEQSSLTHSHAEFLAYHFLHLAVLRNSPLVLTFHGLPPTGIGQLSAGKRAILYRHASKVIVNTSFALNQVVGLGCSPDKVTILPQGLPLEDFPFQPRSAPAPGEPVQLLSVGRFHRDKGQAYSLLALRRLLDAGVLAHWRFVGVGPDRARLETWVRRLGLEGHVEFLEGLPAEDLQALYHQCHLFVLASISSPGGHVETQGVVLQEAQASGCIPVATRVGGIPECVHHQQDALLVREKSSRAIAEAVQYMLARPQEWAAYQAAGRRNVEENYSADVIGQRMADLLRGVVAEWQGYR